MNKHEEVTPKTHPITADEVKAGFMTGNVRLESDDFDCVMCHIGRSFGNRFYFGGMDAEGVSPREYALTHDFDEIVQDIADAANEIGKTGCMDEWLFYRFVLDRD